MNYLTIEKFSHHSRTSISRKMIVALFIFVVPLMMLAAWALYDLRSVRFAQVANEEEAGNELIIVTRD